MRSFVVFVVALAVLAAACGDDSESTAPTTTTEQTAPEPTVTEAPTTTAPPTTTAAPATTAAPTTTVTAAPPAGGLPPADPDAPAFREDFDAAPAAPWAWLNEDPSRWRVTDDGRLEITAANPPIAPETPEIPQVNLLARPIPAGVDIALTTRLRAEPGKDFEQAALFLLEDGDSFVLLNLGFCRSCGGSGVYLETASDGQPMLEGEQFELFPIEGNDVRLRLEYSPEGNAVVAAFAIGEGDWQRIGDIVRDPPAFTHVAIGAANVPGPDGGSGPDLVASFDHVELELFE